jgi:hypothetical protein
MVIVVRKYFGKCGEQDRYGANLSAGKVIEFYTTNSSKYQVVW